MQLCLPIIGTISFEISVYGMQIHVSQLYKKHIKKFNIRIRMCMLSRLEKMERSSPYLSDVYTYHDLGKPPMNQLQF